VTRKLLFCFLSSADGFRALSIFDAIKQSELCLLAIPYTTVSSLQSEIAEAAEGKIIIDCTNPLKENWSPLNLGSENSAAEEISRLFPKSRIVKCFNTIFADMMTAQQLKSLLPRKVTAFIAGEYVNRIVYVI
jgi:8-hydroxy-5-deazaflavin:NADPH oxidoreductase